MAATTAISWTDATFNPWRGCTKVAPECEHCYADTMSKRNPKTLGVWGPRGTRVVAAESYWKQPLKWDRAAAGSGERRRVFCASLADVFEDWDQPISMADGSNALFCDQCMSFISDDALNTDYSHCDCGQSIGRIFLAKMSDVRRRLFALIDQTPHLDWLLLTKRPENVRWMWPKPINGHDHGSIEQIERTRQLRRVCGDCWRISDRAGLRPNVWLGTSCGHPDSLHRVESLKECRSLAPVLFVFAEPLLADLPGLIGRYETMIDWVIAGGESGPGARPCNIEWIRSIRDQCKAAGTAFFCKQLGADVRGTWDEFAFLPNCPMGKELIGFGDFGDGAGCADVIKLTDKKGGDMDEWPEDLQIRELPTTGN